MEKHTAHCKLPVVRKLIEAGKVKATATATAFQGARACGIGDLDGICAVILGLRPCDFHKSMTTHATIASGRMSTTPGCTMAWWLISSSAWSTTCWWFPSRSFEK